MKTIKKFALGLLILIVTVAGAIALMGQISGKESLSCIVSCGLIAIGLVLAIFLMWMANDRDASITSSLFEPHDEPGQTRAPIPIRRANDERLK